MNPDQANELRRLLQQVGNKDGEAFRRLYDLTSAKLFPFSLRILVKRELAEEALQEAFVSIWNNAASYQQSLAAPMTWMVTVVRNKALDIVRRTDKAVELDAADFDKDLMETLKSDDLTPDQVLERGVDAKALARCMSRLEGLHRQAIAMAFFHDLSHSEVAQQLKLPIGTVKSWIRRGLQTLQGCLSSLERT